MEKELEEFKRVLGLWQSNPDEPGVKAAVTARFMECVDAGLFTEAHALSREAGWYRVPTPMGDEAWLQ